MNNDLISREALKKAIDEVHQKDLKSNPLWGSIGLNTLNRLIDNAPLVSALQGKWIETNELIGEHFHNVLVCNQCGARAVDKLNFCPDCGAEMKGGAE